jgi:alanine racemase
MEGSTTERDARYTTAGAALDPVQPLAVEIDLDALEANLGEVERRIRSDQKIIASVKADGYGHSAVPIAKTLADQGVFALATQAIGEAVAIREAGVDTPILMFSGPLPGGIGALLDHDLTPTVYDLSLARAVSEAASRPTPVYVKVDCGLARLGVSADTAVDFVLEVAQLPNLVVEGVYTHIPFANRAGREWAARQLTVFEELCAEIASKGLEVPVTQALGSAGIVGQLNDGSCSAVLPGHILYGLPPVLPEVDDCSGFQPVLRSIRTQLIQIRAETARDAGFGGGAKFAEGTVTGIVPIGLSNGYRSAQSGRPVMLIRGKRAPVLGVYQGTVPVESEDDGSLAPKSSLHYTMLDLTDVPGAAVGDEVLVAGTDGDEHIGVADLAQWQKANALEVLTSFVRHAPYRFVRQS